MQNQSTLSKKFKTPAQKARAVERNRANHKLRASLESQKASAGSAEKRYEIQRKIDQIGAGKQA